MRRCDTIRGRKVEDRRKEEEMTTPISLPQLDEPTLTELRRRYKETSDAETRTRYQMLLLSLRGQTSSQIAQMVLRSQDTVVRVLKRFLTGGLDAVPRRTAPGRERTVTAAWEAELLRVIEWDPHEVGQDTANWTTERLANYLGQQTAVQVTEETVRVYLHAHDYVCKRSTWTLRRKAEEKAQYVGNACG
jgi:transposase